MNTGKELQLKKNFKDFTKADKIIQYLLNPNDAECELTTTEQEKLELLKKVHGYRNAYTSKQDIISIMKSIHGLSERQCYNLINECEYVFGNLSGVHKEYERNFLLDQSRKNISIAFASKNSNAITKALLAHHRISGLEEFVPEMPDFSQLEPHQFIINLPQGTLNILMAMVNSGAINLTDFIPPESINTANIPEAKEIDHEDPS